MDKTKARLEGKSLPIVISIIFLDVLGVGINMPVIVGGIIIIIGGIFFNVFYKPPKHLLHQPDPVEPVIN